MERKVTIKYKKSINSFNVDEMSDWEKVADFLVGLMKPGMVVALQGDLGAGKTTLTQYIAKQLGVAKRALSPTFALIRTYIVRRTSYTKASAKHALHRMVSGHEARSMKFAVRSEIRKLVHVDAYRIEDERDLLALDLDEELAEQGAVMVVEWPERISTWINKQPEKIEVFIELIS